MTDKPTGPPEPETGLAQPMVTECCGVSIASDRFCPKCGWEARARAAPSASRAPEPIDIEMLLDSAESLEAAGEIYFPKHLRMLVQEVYDLRAASRAPDVVCQHGTAMDVHCCHCHSGFIFDRHHECPELPPDALREIASRAMVAQSDPHVSAEVYRKALIDICNYALQASSRAPEPLTQLLNDLVAAEKPLPPDAQRVLTDHYWELLVGLASRAPEPLIAVAAEMGLALATVGPHLQFHRSDVARWRTILLAASRAPEPKEGNVE